jgi:hypothetical protein
MGFGLFGGGQAQISLEIDRPHAYYLPGDRLEARVTVEGEKDLDIQEGRAELICEETYIYRYTDSDGDSRKSKGKDQLVELKQSFLGQTKVAGGSVQTFDLAFDIPAWGVPTYGGKIVNVRWLVKAVLDVRLRRDIREEIEFTVAASPAGQAGGAGQYGASSSPQDCELAFWLPGKEFREGDSVEAKALIQTRERFGVRAVRVELQRIEHVPYRSGNTNKVIEQKIELMGAREFGSGEDLELPFTCRLPAAGRPTLRTKNSSVRWVLALIMDRQLRKDFRAEEDIYVFTIPQEQPQRAPARPAPIQSRPCPHCGHENRPDVDWCVSCGAPLQ